MPLTPQDAFAECFVRFQHRVFGYIVSLLANHDDAEEVFQQTSLILWRKWDQYDGERDFVAWACGIARLEVLSFSRRSDRKGVSLSNDTLEMLVDSQLSAVDLDGARDQALRKCLSELAPKQRELIEQCYGQDAKHRVIAERLGINAASLYMRLHRVRRLLMQCIERRLATESAAP